jgi:hypothetical protein
MALGSGQRDPERRLMRTISGASPRQLARIAGALYLINVVGGAFAIGYVQATLFSSDPAVTAANLQAHQLLYRLGLAVHVLVTVTNVPLALIFYELFKGVSRRIALLDAFFILVATAIEAGGLSTQFAPLALLSNRVGPVPAEQFQELVSLSGHLSHADYTIYTVFFGLDLLCLAYLVLRSSFLPRAIGVLLAVDGVAYLAYAFTDFLAPDLANGLTPWIQLPAPLAEGLLSVWLLVFGVRLAGRKELPAVALPVKVAV